MQACPGYATYSVDVTTALVTVNGTVPVWQPGSAWETKIAKLAQRWGEASKSACALHGVPLTWFLGVMAIESGGNPAACSPPQSNCPGRCCAFGLMQFISQTARCYGKDYGIDSGDDLIARPDVAIELAARFLSDRAYGLNPYGCSSGKAFGLDLPRLAASYNAGSARCSGDGTFGLFDQHDYAMNVVRSANTAYRLGVEPWPVRSVAKIVGGALLAVAGLVTAYVVAGYRR